MLTKSSLSNSLDAAMSFASDFGKQHNMELLCDFPRCGETWQKYPLGDIPQGSYSESLTTVEGENRLTCSGIVEISRSYSDPSVGKDMSASSAPKLDGYVYKRRKLRRNIVVLSEENAEESNKESTACHFGINSSVHPLIVHKDDDSRDPPLTVDSDHSLDSADPSTSGQLDLQKPAVPSTLITYSRNRIAKPFQNQPNKSCYIIALPAEVSSDNRHKSAMKKYPHISNRCSHSKSYTGSGLAIMKNEMRVGKFSSSDAIGAETLEDCAVTRDLCNSYLKSLELLVELDTTNICSSSEALGAVTNVTHLCKACNHLENTQKLLICDLCEEAFHVSCCNPKVKRLQLDVWYCQSCSKKRKRTLLENLSSEDRDKRLRDKIGPILFMLRDNQPYRSGVRVGEDFQAEVLEWAGPTISDGDDYFDKPSELDPAHVSHPDWNADESSEASFISNWVQCRQVIDDDNQIDEGTVCGKWRRAPLFIVQTDDWDCSSSLPWDPIHADCVVPQELETEVVLEHLKCIEMLRPKLAHKQRSLSSKK
ncbi:uncharacterized protein M6B38_405010 [Iris pallida]|uniref:PHD-type domain-containing protein n=1 Tax=Iris pallida TaxID=29817 RepID=A0AAX6FSH2_IRIPA|nr:uncharacterized protein M6B38_405010 [Iris pallida]